MSNIQLAHPKFGRFFIRDYYSDCSCPFFIKLADFFIKLMYTMLYKKKTLMSENYLIHSVKFF